MYARIILNKLFLPMWPISYKSATLLAAYVVMHVKDCIPSCGKETDIIGLRRDFVDYMSQDDVLAMEELFRACGRVEAGLLNHIFVGPERSSLPAISREVKRLRRRVQAIFSSKNIDKLVK
jgi:hypothetical protein